MKEHFAQPKPLAAIVRHAAKSACIAAFAMTALLLPRTVRAQHAPVAFRNLNTSDGLCSNYVKGITQDHRGCLWVATEAGLARFDGSGFTTFSRSTSGLCSDELNDVYYHPATRRLWIASQRDGISVYDIDRQRMAAHYTADNGLMTNDVTHISGAADGGIWITHYHLGVEHFSPATGRFTRYDQTNVRGLKGLRSWVVADDGRGHLFIGHDGGGMSVVDLRTRSLRRFAYSPAAAAAGGIPGPVVHSILFDRQGRCWVGTSQGLALFSLSTGRFTTFRHNAAVPGSILSDQVMSIGQTRSGDLWVCTDMGGVSILRAGTVPAEGAFENHAMQPSGGGLSSASAFDFFEDSYGNVWIGNYRSGLDYLSHTPSLFTTLPYARLSFSSLSYKPVWGLLADGTGRLWMGGEDELVAMDGQQTAASVNLNAVGRNVHVNALHRTPDGLLWLGLYNRGMAVFSPATQHVTPVAMPDGPVTVNCFARDAHGTLWAGTERGLVVIAGGEVRPAAALNSQMADLMVRSIAFDRRGQLWVGTFGRGVYVFNAQGRAVAHVERGSGLRSNAVNQLMLARDGSMWAATRLGLAHFADVARPGSVKVFGHDRGLTEEHVHAIAEDADGNVWLSTNAHIARFVTRRLSFDNFAPRMGMPTGDFVSGSVAQGIDGSIYFGSLAGVCRFNPRDFKRLTAQADVCITGLVAYGSPGAKADSVIALPLDQPEVRVPYNRNTIRLTFNVADVAQAPLTEYAYRVAEFADGQWLSTQGENYVTFRDLAPGTYNISIRSRMDGQQWDTHTAMVRIVVAPPFWLAWYAKLLYAALAVLLVWWLMRSYKHKTDLESRLRIEHHRHMNDVSLNQERLRFYTNITHELRTPLTLIVGPLDDMASDATVPAPVQSRLAVIRRSANRLLGLVNELLEFRKTETQNRRLRVIHGDLAEEVKGIVLHFKELNRRPEVTLRTDIAEGSYVQWFDPEIIRIVLDNFLSNAMKYTPEGEVLVALAHEGARTVLRVSDTGYGIPAEALPHLFQRYYQAGGPHQVTGSGIGLALVKSVAELHHATVSAANGEQGGSVFSFTLLTADTYGHDEAEAATPEAPQPAAEAEGGQADDRSGRQADHQAPADTPAAQLPTLLVVEDNAELRDYIRQSLRARYRVLTAADGREGLERAQSDTPDVVLTDVMMPVMDGYELCRRLKADVGTSHVPVILLTAKDLMDDKAEGYAAGADSYLTKPFSARLLTSRIDNLLRVRRQLAEVVAQRMATPPAAPAAGNDAAANASQAGAAGAASAVSEENAAAEQPAAHALSPVDQKFLTKLDTFVLTHLEEEKLDVGYIASEMCMSHSTLYRKVKALIGISVNEYVRRTRLRRAAELLTQGDFTIAEVADRTGFSTPSYFRQCFKDAYGITPSDYAAGKRK